MAALNPTSLMRFLGMQLGISHSRLEVEGEFMLKVARERSLPTFSKYYPFPHRIVMNSKANEIDGRTGFLRIPPALIDPSEIRFVMGFIPDTYWRSREQYIPFNTDVFSMQMEMDQISAKTLKSTFKFYPPNLVDISPKNLYFQDILLIIAADHHRNFFTISPQLVDIFKDLVLIDVKHAIFNIRKNFPNLMTAFGNIEMELETISDMETKRADLEELMKKNYYKTTNRRRIYTG